MKFYHDPVMLKESIEFLDIKENGYYVDATFGGGGHSRIIAEKLSSAGRVIGFDQDEDSYHYYKEHYRRNKKIIFIRDNFKNIKKGLKGLNIDKIDGVIYDLGISSKQIDDAEKGFSFSKEDSPLNMNMGLSDRTAEDVLNEYELYDLKSVFKNYGEMKNAGRFAQAIVKGREAKRLVTTGDLLECVERLLPRDKKNSVLAKLYQAVRIEVNGELEVLKASLGDVLGLLKPGGRLVVISYHSLEDRIVKTLFQRESKECLCPPEMPVCRCGHRRILKILTRKPLTCSQEELEKNARARSAKLRVACKIINGGDQ